MSNLIKFIKEERKKRKMDQQLCALMAGVSIQFLRNLEQGKKTLQMDKVNQILGLFGRELGPVDKVRPEIE